MVSGRMCQFPEMEASQLWAGREAHLRPTNVRRHSGGDGGQGASAKEDCLGPSHSRYREAPSASDCHGGSCQSSGFKWVWLLIWWLHPGPLPLDRPPPVVSPCSVCGRPGVHAHLRTGC